MNIFKKSDIVADKIRKFCEPVDASEKFRGTVLKKMTGENSNEAVRPIARNIKMNANEIRITARIQDDVLTGNISLPEEVRLSDFLNAPMKFIRLTEATVTRPGDTVEHLSEIHINKDSITMLSTAEDKAARGTGWQNPVKMYPVIKKLPVRTRMHMADYELDGLLHCKSVNGIMPLLEQENTFLPCTEVSIRDIRTNKEWRTGFTAVNRRLVNSLHKAE